ncbi:hypothetical protein VTN00DRAFT_6766 [Thermoascus crustaceus]|uniref:uncharacterized protein n=1 Tax=Thermoascus crustaceus TaxID=5088 RepID=UPI003743E096
MDHPPNPRNRRRGIYGDDFNPILTRGFSVGSDEEDREASAYFFPQVQSPQEQETDNTASSPVEQSTEALPEIAVEVEPEDQEQVESDVDREQRPSTPPSLAVLASALRRACSSPPADPRNQDLATRRARAYTDLIGDPYSRNSQLDLDPSFLGGRESQWRPNPLILNSNRFRPIRSPSRKSGILPIRHLLLFFPHILKRALSPKHHVIRLQVLSRAHASTFLTSNFLPITLPLTFRSKSKKANKFRSLQLHSISSREVANTLPEKNVLQNHLLLPLLLTVFLEAVLPPIEYRKQHLSLRQGLLGDDQLENIDLLFSPLPLHRILHSALRLDGDFTTH